MNVERIKGDFSVCKVEQISPEYLKNEFCFTGKTDRENSLVCPTHIVPKETLQREDGWRLYRIQGQLDFSLVGILAKISSVLARAGVSIFAISTFDTDYIMIKKDDEEKAVRRLSENGYNLL